MDTTVSRQQSQFPFSSTRRMPCKHWHQFPVRRTCIECLDKFCDKCRCKLPPYSLDEKNLDYQHEEQFYSFLHRHPKAMVRDPN